MWNSSLQKDRNTRENSQESLISGPADKHSLYFKRCMIYLILFICLSFSPLAISQAAPPTSRILVLNSYHKGFPWVDNIVKGIESVLEREKIDANLVIEYMDSKAIKYDTSYKEMLYKLYYHKYSRQKFDVIISSDDNAFNFLREYHQKIFPDIPIVFCGVNNLKAPGLINRDQFTGILEISGEKETIDLALKLHPETKQIVVVTDTTPSGKYYFGQIKDHFNQFPDIKFSRIDDSISIEQIEDKLSKLSDETIVLYTSMYRDKTGRYISLEEGTSRISKASRRPIYIFHAQVLQYGTIGGKLLAGQHHGEKSAEMAIQILQGEKVLNIPIVDQSIAQYIFDYQQLERFGIKLSDLPEESYIINKPVSYYEQSKQEIWIAFWVFSFLVTVVVILALNIMRSRKTELERLKSEEKLRLLFDHSPVGICTVDLIGNFVTTNPAYELMLGYSKEELRDLSFFDVTHPNDRPKNKKLFQSMFSLETTSFSMKKRYIRKNGSQIDVTVHAIGIMDVEGNVRFGTAFVDDITERKLAEEALRESEEKLNALFTSLTEMIVMHELVLNASGEAIDYRIMDCNKVFTEVTGIRKEEVIGKLASEVYQTDPPPYLEIYAKVGLSGDPHEFTTFYPKLDKHFMISVVSPQAGKFATITTDISDMMQIQEMIMAKNKEMENYLYVASHDLRTPLVNIQGFSQRLKKQADSIKTLFADKTLEPEILHQLGNITDENIPKTLSFILSNIEKMDTLINGLLQLSRTGRVEMNIQKIDMNELFATILQSHDFQIKEAQCEIHIDPLPECYGDAALLDQLFANIISNALKYSDSQRALEITVDAKKIQNRVVYAIRDTGKGIAQKHLDKIWDIFYRIDPRSSITGEGIGLSLVKRIAEKHKGKVWAEAEENKGSVFHIELNNRSFTEI